jgi:hypothetical protein
MKRHKLPKSILWLPKWLHWPTLRKSPLSHRFAVDWTQRESRSTKLTSSSNYCMNQSGASAKASQDFSTSLDLSASRFSALDGTADSIQLALSILEDVISQNSGLHLIIIDGLDILCSSEGPVLADHLIALLNILMSIKHMVITKTLVLMTQHMRLLAELPGLVRKVDASSLDGSGGFFSLEDFERGLQGSMGMEVAKKHA